MRTIVSFHGGMTHSIRTWTRVLGRPGQVVFDYGYWGHRMMRNWQCCELCPFPPCEATASPELDCYAD